MSGLITLFSPISLLFFMIAAGLIIGRIRIKGVSLGIAGVLFVSMFFGFLLNYVIAAKNPEIIIKAQSTLKTFSTLGGSLFISVIGLQTGSSVQNHFRGSLSAFAIGGFMSMSGVTAMLFISRLDKTIRYSSLLGILCGALTSTPGLSGVCESVGNESEYAIWGYGCSYPLGVILVVFFTQWISGRNTGNQRTEKPSQTPKNRAFPALAPISLTALFGNFFGHVKIASAFSLGTTACTLMVGLLFGYFFGKKSGTDLMATQGFDAFRNLGLALFFAGTGFSTGTQPMPFDAKAIGYGAFITLVSLLCGWILCKRIEKKQPLHQGFVIAGGMTSSPAYGIIGSQANASSLNLFSFSYFGALLFFMAALQIIGR